MRSAILALLDDRPMHGYEMITELDERTGGRWRPSAGSIYPTLQLLEDEGLVTAEEVGDDGMLYELLVLIGPEDERSAQIVWYLSRFREGLVLSTTAFNTEALAREAIERGD